MLRWSGLVLLVGLLCAVSADARSDKKKQKDPPALQVGMSAPPEMKVGDIPMKQFHGHPLLIHVWATWCGPCMQFMPAFISLLNSYADKDLQVVMVDQDNSAAKAQKYLSKQHITLKDIHCDKSLSRELCDRAIPETIVINREGVVSLNEIGVSRNPNAESEDRLRQAIDDAIATPVHPPAASSEHPALSE